MPTVNLGPCECCGGGCNCGGVSLDGYESTFTIVGVSPSLQNLVPGLTHTVQGYKCGWLVGDGGVTLAAGWTFEGRAAFGIELAVGGSMTAPDIDSQGRAVYVTNQRIGVQYAAVPLPCSLPFAVAFSTPVYLEPYWRNEVIGSLDWEVSFA